MSLPTVGTLEVSPALSRRELLADVVACALDGLPSAASVGVAPVDEALSDTAEFTRAYAVPAQVSANCVVVAGRRDGVERTAACVVLATTRADVNGAVRRLLDVRKCSFLPMDRAVAETGMEYGGITPVGLPADWLVLVDAAVAAADLVVVGSGVRRSKLVLPGGVVAGLPSAQVVERLGVPVTAG